MLGLDKYHSHPLYLLYWVHCKKKWTLDYWVSTIEGSHNIGIKQASPIDNAAEFIEKYNTNKC